MNTIIHNAWRVDFTLALSSFEPHIRGTRMLLDLALASSNAASLRFIFVSSIGSVLGWDPNKGPVPEEHLCDPAMAVSRGYGESKFVAEEVPSFSPMRFGNSLLRRSFLDLVSKPHPFESGSLPVGPLELGLLRTGCPSLSNQA